MGLLIILILMLILIPAIAITVVDKVKPTEGKKVYFETIEMLKHENEEKVKNYLKKKYNLSSFVASSLISAAKRKLNEHFETIFNTYKKA